MARTRLFTPIATAALCAALAACTVHKQDAAPSLTGPSGLGTNITVQVSPDVLTQDGASQSAVLITVTDSNGQPLRNLSMRVDITVNGALTDFGSLSARNVVTDASGRANVVYTAPAAVPGSVDAGILVEIQATPAGTDFANAVASHMATIRLVPPGVIGAPQSALIPSFAPPSANVGDAAAFSATVLDAKGNDASGQVTSFVWNFGDGTTGNGRSLTHIFTKAGTRLVSLTITDAFARTSTVSNSVNVGPPTTVTPTFFTTPSSPVSGESIIFNASQTTAPAGHAITSYSWDFGDGSGGATGPVVQHTFASPGTYTALLTITLDNGAVATASQTMTVAPPNPTARINLSPPTGAVGQTITFLGNKSTPAAGRTLVNYTWNFGDGSSVVSGSTSSVAHAYGIAGTYTITLLVTDDQGNQDLATAQITIQ